MSDFVREQSDKDDCKTEEGYTGGIAYFYDQSTPPTFVEHLFGEPYHISDKYASHQITVRLIFTLMLESIVTGSILWLEIAFRYYFISLWSIGPAQFTEILCIIQIPFTIRMLYGLLIDSVPFFGYRRKSYLFLFGTIAVISSLVLVTHAHSFIAQIAMLCVRSFAIAFCDVIISAITVERSEYKSHTVAVRLQSLNYFSMYVISGFGLIIAARMEQTQKPSQIINVYWMYFGVTFLILFGAILLPEKSQKKTETQSFGLNLSTKSKPQKSVSDYDSEIQMLTAIDSDIDIETEIMHAQMNRISSKYSMKQILSLAFETFCRKIVFYPLLFTFLIAAMPKSQQTIDYYLMYALKFDSHKIGFLQIISSMAFLFSVIIITIHSRSQTFSLRILFAIWTFIAAVIPYSTLLLIFGINDTVFGVSDFIFSIFNTVIVRICVNMLLLGTAVLYARICPPGIEGVFFTLLTSIATIGEVISYFLSSFFIALFDIECAKVNFENKSFYGLTIHNSHWHGLNALDLQCDFDNLWLFIIAVNLTSLIPLMWIFWIPNETEMRVIAMTLRQSAIHKLSQNKSTQIGNHDKNEKNESENEMILLYFICNDYLVPAWNQICHCLCCCRPKRQNRILHHNHINHNNVNPF